MQTRHPINLPANASPQTQWHGLESGRVLNINKPEGWTSFDVVKKVRRLTQVKKVGHAGTLDPFATGVLIICMGKATKRVEEFMALKKEYVARIELGKRTDTYDRTGRVLSVDSVHDLSTDQVRDICNGFRGEQLQVPPMYSARKVNGQRLYKLARQGKQVARKAKRIVIHELDVQKVALPFVTLRIVCSRGTYIRSIANDVGEKLGCGGCLDALVRTKIGSYRLEEAWTVENFLDNIQSSAKP